MVMNRELKNKLLGRKVLIWGARIVGIGLRRKCSVENIEVVGFIDSDISIQGKVMHGNRVYSPSEVSEVIDSYSGHGITIVIAVSIKEEEIKRMLSTCIEGKQDTEIILYKHYNTTYYTIDVVSSCNLSCMSCAHSLEGPKPGGIMKMEDVRSVLSKIKNENPNCSHVSLYSWGEPLIHPQLDEIIRLFHDEAIAVGLSTNLSHEDFKKIERVLRANPDYLKISLSGYYQEAYQHTHQGGDIELVKSNLYKVAYLIRKLGLQTMVDINYHLYKDNSGENYARMKDLAEELGFIMSEVYALVMPLERVLNERQGKPDKQTEELQENLLVTIEEGVNASKQINLEDGCPFMHNQMNINSDLSVPVCCLVYDRKYLVSNNYLEDTLETIESRKDNSEICRTCMSYNLPQYNMGFNKGKWVQLASEKICTDLGFNAKC